MTCELWPVAFEWVTQIEDSERCACFRKEDAVKPNASCYRTVMHGILAGCKITIGTGPDPFNYTGITPSFFGVPEACHIQMSIMDAAMTSISR